MLTGVLVSLQYFALISHLLEVYPEKVANLNKVAFARIIGSLEFGLRNQARAFSVDHLLLFFALSFDCIILVLG
jgi:hypothetical protein